MYSARIIFSSRQQMPLYDGKYDSAGNRAWNCIMYYLKGYETFDSEEGRRLMNEWGVPEGYACQGFVILGYIDGEQPNSKPRKN